MAFKRTIAMALAGGILLLFAANTSAQRQMEYLQRGVIAIHQGEGRVFVSWRMLGTEPDEIGFNLYRSSNGEEPLKLNDQPLTQATNFVDRRANLDKPNAYFVRPVLKGQEQMSSDSFVLSAHAQPYMSIPLQTLEGYRPNDASVGDLDGDGVYENVEGYILAGPEYLTVFDGKTGAALVTTDYIPPRHPTTLNPTSEQLREIWGDGYGNRVDRFLACIAWQNVAYNQPPHTSFYIGGDMATPSRSPIVTPR